MGGVALARGLQRRHASASIKPTGSAAPQSKGKTTMSPEHDQSRRFAEKSAAIANETLEKGKAAMEQSYSAAVENFRDFNVRIIDAARANADAAFEFARQIAAAKTPSDYVELWTAHAQRQFAMLSEQTKELTALGQKIAGESAEPITRSVNQAFKKAS
jgi:phasin family protein